MIEILQPNYKPDLSKARLVTFATPKERKLDGKKIINRCDPDFFPCGHPRIEENKRFSGHSPKGDKGYRCKTCHDEKNRLFKQKKREANVSRIPRIPVFLKLESLHVESS